MATPVNLKELRSFLGLACYYKQFIENYSMHAAPLNLLTRKNTPFFWGSEQKQAFMKLRDALLTPMPVMSLLGPSCTKFKRERKEY